MKKLTYLLLGAAGLTLASCSQEEISGPIANGNDGNVKLTVKLPENFRTRADGDITINDGLQAINLYYAIYDADNNNSFVDEGQATFEDADGVGQLSTVLGLQLATQKSYKIALFATAEDLINGTDNVYSFNVNPESGVPYIGMNYDNMQSDGIMADTYDCFYNLAEIEVVSKTNNEVSATLYRPIAQLNWGTNDLDNKAIYDENAFGVDGQYIVTNLTITNAYTQYSLLDNTVVEGSQTQVAINNFANPYTLNYPVGGYEYVAMQYVLAPNGEYSLYNLTLNVSNRGNEASTDIFNDVDVINAPVEANYQTNIYGALLSDNVYVIVDKSPDWNLPSYNVPMVWDGYSVTAPLINTDNKTVDVTLPSNLAGLAAMVNGTFSLDQEPMDFAGYTINLAADLDMGGNSLMIGNAYFDENGQLQGTPFAGYFNGNGHTISNLTINAPATRAASGVVTALFPYVLKDENNTEDTGVESLTLENFVLNGDTTPWGEKWSFEEAYGATGLVGVLESTNDITDSPCFVAGVTIKSGEINGSNNVGSIVGWVKGVGCSLESNENYANVNGSVNVGGIIGNAYINPYNNGYVVDEFNYGNVTANAFNVGGIIGISTLNEVGYSDNRGTVSTYNDDAEFGYSVGGIIGECRAGAVHYFHNYGEVSGTWYGIGGIIGWVRYYPWEDETVYTYNGVGLMDSFNYASVSGYSCAGGIVGSWYSGGSCLTCENQAPSITATNGPAAGIIGYSDSINSQYANVETLTLTGNTSTTPLDEIHAPAGQAWTIISMRYPDIVKYENNSPENNNK